jgi:flagellar basal body rod protein FlgG
MLESSNVNPFRTMIEMMETTRHFEMYQKSMQASKEMDSSLNSMVHRL